MSPATTARDLPVYEYPKETAEKLEYADLEALDISKLDQPGGKQILAEQVLSFINKNGFFYVTGHGFTDEEVRRQYAICQAVLDLPLEEKLKYQCDTAAGDFRGYKPQSTGNLAARDNDERYNIPKFTPEHARPHPQPILDHWDEIRDFSRRVHDALLLPLLRLFATVLELEDEDFFVRRHRYEAKGLEYLRYMRYFPRLREEDAAAGNIWAKGHTDYNTLTFLFHQPVAGLQVQTPEGQWKYVRSPRDAVIVNIADALEFLSGGYLKSTVHRVVRPPEDQADRPRLSLIYFARPGKSHVFFYGFPSVMFWNVPECGTLGSVAEANIILEPVDSPLLKRIGLGERSEKEKFARKVTAEEWARARIAKDHRFRTGVVDQREKEIIAGVAQTYYD